MGDFVLNVVTMQEYFARLEALDDIDEVLWTNVHICEDQGIVRQSYHFTPAFDAPNSNRTVVQARGFKKEWLKLYDESNFRAKDPIPQRTMNHGSLLTWKDAMRIGSNTPENEEYFAAMRQNGLIHGFGIPLFGPRGRNAFASFDFNLPWERVDAEKVAIVRSASQAGHQRICVLLDRQYEPITLTQREQEVLDWLAKGKSVAAIATILDISPDTVKTYLKRLYAKLDVSHRTGAVVRALKLGLVNA